MSVRFQILLVFLIPILLVGGAFAFGMSIPVPHLGRDYVVEVTLPEAGARVDLPNIAGPQDRSRPLVVIDAGHGGKDPGAISAGYKEKDLVLGLALALRDRLIEDGGVRVAMTRDDDTFLILEDRPEVARQLKADLFVSIHADSSANTSGVRGASIYTLSATASSEAAALFAARENRADALNGVVVDQENSQVTAILVELSQRRVQEASDEFARLIIREGEGTLRFHPQARRSAALAVLRAPDVPAILYESGFISNPSDAARLASDAGKDEFSETMSKVIRIYFARQSNQ